MRLAERDGGLAPRYRDRTTNNKQGLDWATKSHCPQRFSEDGNQTPSAQPLYSFGRCLPRSWAGAWASFRTLFSLRRGSRKQKEIRNNHTMNTRFSFLPAAAARRLSRAGRQQAPPSSCSPSRRAAPQGRALLQNSLFSITSQCPFSLST